LNVSPNRQQIEDLIRSNCDLHDYDTATTIAIREYGPEILGVLAARLRNETDACEVFSTFCEDFWRGLPDFRWQCSARVWAYTLARYAANRYTAAASRIKKRNVPFSQAGHLSEIVEEVRTTTLDYLRTEVKNEMRRLREQLSIEDQELLILRVDKQLSFRDMAIVVLYQGKIATEQELVKDTARLRKRFQKAKETLRRLAQQAGLTVSGDDSTG